MSFSCIVPTSIFRIKKNVIYTLTIAFLGASGRSMHTCIRMINVMPNIMLNHTMRAFI